MTGIKGKLVRVSNAAVFELGRPRLVVLEITGRVLTLRLEGLRTRYPLELDALYHAAVKTKVAADQKAKDKNKKTRRRTR